MERSSYTMQYGKNTVRRWSNDEIEKLKSGIEKALEVGKQFN